MSKEDQILLNLKNCIEEWKPFDRNYFSLNRQSGLTNITYKVSLENKKEEISKVIYREFCKNHVYIERDHEMKAFKLMERNNFGPKCLCYGNGYRVEQFIEGVHPLQKETTTPFFRKLITYNIAQIHSLTPVEFEKVPVIEKSLNPDSSIMKMFKEKKIKIQKMRPDLIPVLDSIENEIPTVISFLPKKTERNIKFCHNDLLNFNIFKLKHTVINDVPELMFIDYEYSGYNYREIDIANFLAEQTFDYTIERDPYFVINTQLLPNDKEVIDIATYYLYFYLCITEQKNPEKDAVLLNQEKLREKIGEYFDEKIFQQEVEEIADQVKLCFLFAHFFWIIWGVISGDRQDVPFNYLEFAKQRFENYLFLKKNLKQKN